MDLDKKSPLPRLPHSQGSSMQMKKYERSRNIPSKASTISRTLRKSSANLQSAQPISNRPKDGKSDRDFTKRTRLVRESRSTSQDRHGKTAPLTSVHSTASFTRSYGYGTNPSGVEISLGEGIVKSVGNSNPGTIFRKACKIDILDIENMSEAVTESCPLVEAEFETIFTLEIFADIYDKTPMISTPEVREELFSASSVGNLKTVIDSRGRNRLRAMLKRPFIIPAERLFVERDLLAVRCGSDLRTSAYRFQLADHYLIKIWLEPHHSESKWPPIDFRHILDPEGKIRQWISCGVFAEKDIRLLCKGIIYPGLLLQEPFTLELNLAGKRQNTQFRVKIDVQWSHLIPSQTYHMDNLEEFPELPESHNVDAVDEERLREGSSPLGLRPHYLENPGAEEPDIEDNGVALSVLHAISPGPWKLTCYKSDCGPSSRLIIPKTSQKLYYPATKHILKIGEEISINDHDLEDSWRTVKHVDVIKDLLNISDDARDYVIRWDRYVTSLKLSSNLHLSRPLIDFIDIHRGWLSERQNRVRECSLHATILRLRGSIQIECYARCIILLHECDKLLLATVNTSREINPEEVIQNSRHEDAGIEIVTEPYYTDKEIVEDKVDEASADKFEGYDIEALEEAVKEDILKDTHHYSSDSSGESSYEDSSEYPQVPPVGNSFGVDTSRNNEKAPRFLRSCWKSITKRWPRLRLHGMDSFGVASMLAAITTFQGFPDSNIDRLIALNIHYCPNENIQDLTNMYYNAPHIEPEMEGIFLTRLKLHKIMWEAGQEKCGEWLTDVYRLPDGSRRSVQDAVDFAMAPGEWDGLWSYIAYDILSE